MANWSQATTPDTDESKAYNFVDLSKINKEDLRVCIAEDNAINRKIAISFVNKLSLKCEAFEDGKLAYEALQRKSKEGDPFHLVLMDVQMPVLDGYEATKAIRKDADPNVHKVLIIAMTASAIRGDREKCIEAGMNDYLAKPVRQTALKSMLDEYLNNTKAAVANATKDLDIRPPGDTVNGAISSAPANGDVEKMGQKAVNSVEAKSPGARRPIKKTVRTSSHLSTISNRSASPPSGKRETDELGKISTDAEAAPETVKASSNVVKEADEKAAGEGVNGHAKENLEVPKN